ncbi:MAG: STAS domain-containing protein [Spirochaetes bacterium]|nr:STAS domain-containing protein [Spirochaetota bacterium]
MSKVITITVPLTMNNIPEVMEKDLGGMDFQDDITVRLADTAGIDLSGVQVLLSLSRKAKRQQVRFSVEGLPSRYQKYFES